LGGAGVLCNFPFFSAPCPCLLAVFFGFFLDNERVFGIQLKNPTTKKPAQLALCGLLNIDRVIYRELTVVGGGLLNCCENTKTIALNLSSRHFSVPHDMPQSRRDCKSGRKIRPQKLKHDCRRASLLHQTFPTQLPDLTGAGQICADVPQGMTLTTVLRNERPFVLPAPA